MFANWKKSKKDFCFWKKEEKQKQCSVLLLEGSILEAGLTWATRRTPPSSFPDNYTLHLSIKLPEPWTMCVSICALFHQSLLMNVKEDTEKAGLKLIIWKTKIMASCSITSWQIDGETMQTVRDYFFFGAPKSLQMVIAAMELKDAYSLEEKLWPTEIAC